MADKHLDEKLPQHQIVNGWIGCWISIKSVSTCLNSSMLDSMAAKLYESINLVEGKINVS